MFSQLLADIRYCLRSFALQPMFAGTVVLTLALAIGVNVAVFSLFDQIVLRELPVARPAELVKLVAPGERGGNEIVNVQGTGDETFSYPLFRDLEAAGEPYADLAASRLVQAALGYGDHTELGSAMLVSGGYFAALEVGPALGRVLGEQDLADGVATTVVLSYEHWTTAFGADPDVLGKTLVVAGQPLTIVGVAPRGFVGTTLGERPDVFAPLTLDWLRRLPTPLIEDRFFAYVYVFGRLQPGVSLKTAEQALDATFRAIINDIEAPALAGREGVDIEAFRNKRLSLASAARGQSRAPSFARTPLAVFFAATATILLIACVNLANLMFARAAGRIGEIAVRASLGAARRRLIGLLAVEALLLAGFAALLSLPVALGVLRIVDALEPPGLDIRELVLNLRAVAVAIAIAIFATVVFALAPISKLVATDPTRALKSSGARAFGGKNLGRFRFALATTQIALSMLLLMLAALFTQSLANVASVDLGLTTESVVAFTVQPGLSGYTPERQAQTFDAIERELAAQPGVTRVTSAAVPLLAGARWSSSIVVEGFEPAPAANNSVNRNEVGAGFFRALDIPLLAGREFTEDDTLDRPLVAIVNERFVERFGLGPNPIGKRLGFDREFDIEIVGLVRDAAYSAVKEPFVAQLITPRRQSRQFGMGATFYIRTQQPPETMLPALPRIVARVDAELPVLESRTLTSQVRRSVQTDWLLVTLAGTLAGAATLLAALGLYGVLSYMVAQRTREIGLRLALGAEPAGVRRMVLRQVAWMVGVGVPAGVAAALLLGNFAAALLFELAPTEPRAVVAAGAILTLAVLGASYWPARRASRVDPMTALRVE